MPGHICNDFVTKQCFRVWNFPLWVLMKFPTGGYWDLGLGQLGLRHRAWMQRPLEVYRWGGHAPRGEAQAGGPWPWSSPYPEEEMWQVPAPEQLCPSRPELVALAGCGVGGATCPGSGGPGDTLSQATHCGRPARAQMSVLEPAGLRVAEADHQHDTARPHHQVPAAPAQEEEAAQHQRPVPGGRGAALGTPVPSPFPPPAPQRTAGCPFCRGHQQGTQA